MLYVKPHFYDEFCCIADRCPDTCCAGWQIVIDEDSLEKYSSVRGGIGNWLFNSIDWEEGAFLQYHGRCSCLNEENLCDLYQELGQDYLCKTCRMYPRHVEEFEGVREFSLSLSCPEAARMILECEEPLRFLVEETSQEEPESYDEFDFLLYSGLVDIRDVLYRIIQNRKEKCQLRMKRCLEAGRVCQSEYDSGNFFDIEESLIRIKEKRYQGDPLDFDEKKSFFHVLFGLEFFHDSWKERLYKVYRHLYGAGEEYYYKIRKDFILDKWEQYAEQLLMFFVYTYFCGAVYDERIGSKIFLAVYSTEIIYDFCMEKWIENNKMLKKEEVWETAWQYAREIEHSDENLETLEEYFDSLCCV